MDIWALTSYLTKIRFIPISFYCWLLNTQHRNWYNGFFSGNPIRHIAEARNGREKGGRWSISSFFRRKSRNSGSESDAGPEASSLGK